MISLYVHVPFCSKKCLFCSFVIAVGQNHRRDEYINALENESLQHKGRAVSTVYFGGGTPGALDQSQLERLVGVIKNNFDLALNAEWTVEVNPESFDLGKAECLKRLGVNRLSIGIQSFHEHYLKFLGRNHDRATAIKAYDIARQAGFDNVNLDLMFAFPGQTIHELHEDLNMLTALGSEHVSIYSLTVQEHSRFFAQELKLDDDDLVAEQYLSICDTLDQRGIHQYEVSNFSREGFHSKHNRHYWLGDEYVGLGMGAHGYLDGRRYWNVSRLQEYLSKVQLSGEARDGFEDLTIEQRMMEKLLFGLRMNEGISLDGIERQAGVKFHAQKYQRLEEFICDGFLERQGGVIKTTRKGRLILDELSSRII